MFCRLNFFLVSVGLVNATKISTITPGFLTDHSCVNVEVIFQDPKRGPDYWKLNCSLLKDTEYVGLMKQTIKDTVLFNMDTNPTILWDTIKTQVRGASVKYASNKKKLINNKIDALMKTISELEDNMGDNFDQFDILDAARTELNNYMECKTKRAILRCKTRWYEDGEKNSKYFFNLEERNYNNKKIQRLVLKDGKEIHDINAILNEEVKFCQQLYTSQNSNNSQRWG